MFVLSLLFGCGSATLTPTQEGCQDYDFNNPDPSVVASVATILPVAGLFQWFDGTQVVGSGVLRGD